MILILVLTAGRYKPMEPASNHAGTHDVLRIALKAEEDPSAEEGEQGQRSTLLPFASEMVPVVDRASRRMEITPPEGLLDIVTTAKKPSAQRQRL